MSEVTGPNLKAIRRVVSQIRTRLGLYRPRIYISGRWTYSGDWLNGRPISGDYPVPDDVHAQWLRAQSDDGDPT